MPEIKELTTLTDPYRDPVQVPKFRSRFGGLWTDLDNAIDLVIGKLELQLITDEEAELLRFFIENGYVILPGAVSAEQADKLDRDILALGDHPPPEAWVSCTEGGRSVIRQMLPGDNDKVGKSLRLLDAYTYLASARDVIFASATMRFVKLIFERPVLAHQSLSFFKGSQQPIHQDTVFVRISSPMELVASWTALEDIQTGSGELIYYPKSHLFPEFLFEGKHKWLPPGSEEISRYYEHVDSSALALGISKSKFQARKGDVFVWNADLAHGGGQIDDPAKTRRSLVCHYCPINTYPMYRIYAGSTEVIKAGDGLYYCSEKKMPWRSGE